jgi:hypothetical protein
VQQWLFALGYLQEMPAQGVKKTVAVYSAAAEVHHSIYIVRGTFTQYSFHCFICKSVCSSSLVLFYLELLACAQISASIMCVNAGTAFYRTQSISDKLNTNLTLRLANHTYHCTN